MPPAPTPWIDCYKPAAQPKLRLFCIPYAGAGAQIYRTWPMGLPKSLDICPIQLPGRWTRRKEPLQTDITACVAAMTDALRPWMADMPFAIFGHSLGGLLAFAMARRLRKTGGPMPVQLLLSAHEAPHLPSPVNLAMANLPDDAFIKQMGAVYNGIPQQVLNEPELLALMLPIMRADISLLESWRYTDEPPLDVPIAAFGGLSDPNAPRADLDAWQQHTTGAFGVDQYEGDHFFISSSQSAVLQRITELLTPYL